MTKINKILSGAVLVFVAIQFIRPAKNRGEVYGRSHISKVLDMPPEVKNILEISCYDCHSNKTHYPWYSNIQPLGWWLASHVNDGKKHLNFSEFATYNSKKQNHKMEETIEMIEKNEMPLKSYTIIHGDSRLTDEKKQVLLNWAKQNFKEEIDD